MSENVNIFEKTCRIFGAVPIDVRTGIEICENDVVIAADGGFDTLDKLGIKADIILGDFDSVREFKLVSESGKSTEILRYPPEKDDTDTMLAVKLGLSRGYRSFALYGCLGGERIDHSIATIQTLAFITENGAKGTVYHNDARITAIRDGELILKNDLSGYLSVFAFGGEAYGVTLENVKYTLNDALLTPSLPVGTSNEFIKGKSAYIRVKKGTLLIVWRTSDSKGQEI